MTNVELKHADVISRMTREEKALLTSGESYWITPEIERLEIPAITLNDGPHGLRKQGDKADHLGINSSVPSTSFPTAATLANSWDDSLLYRVGQAIGSEAEEEDVHVLLGPGLNIKRNPLGGRNFEYFSEDPLLSGKLAAAFIRGTQSVGVGACPKHFAVNSQETYRMSIDEIVDTRAMHEIYLEGFRIAVSESNPWMLMTSYNRVNGTFAHEHPELVSDILRTRWGYDGTVVSDWGGNNDSAAALTAGSNLEMPGSGGIGVRRVLEALESGELDEADLDRRIDEYLTLVARVQDPVGPAKPLDFEQQHQAARRAAEESLVLLQNNAGALPLQNREAVAVIGDFAGTPRYQGAGSSLVNPTRVSSALEALEASDLNVIGYEPGYKRQDRPSTRLANRALDLAERADTVLLFLGLDEGAESEGVDRSHMRLSRNQLALTRDLIRLAQERGTKIVVVLAGGAPVELPFADGVDAILHSYLAGQAGGEAVVNVLTGRANPSGKLAESYPYTYSDVPSASDYLLGEATAEHREGIYIGYRYYDKAGLPVRYPFGYGLSYTTFGYGTAEVEVDEGSGNPVAVAVDVKNTGDVAGAEVVQLYVAPLGDQGTYREEQQLAGYGKVFLEPGESKRVQLELAEHAFSVFDPAADDWIQLGGEYELRVGASSRDIRSTVRVSVDGDVPAAELQAQSSEILPSYFSGDVQDVSDAEFEALLGYAPPSPDWDRNNPLCGNSIIAELPGHSLLGIGVHGAVVGTAAVLDAVGKPVPANYARFLLALPLRAIARMTDGAVSESALEGIIAFLNGEGISWLRAKK